MHKVDRDTFPTKATRAANAVQVCLSVGLTTLRQWHVVVDHERHLLDINTTRNHIGRNQHLALARTEFVNRTITVRGIQLAMQRVDTVTLGGHALRNAIRRLALRTENNTLADRQQVVQLHKHIVLVLLRLAVHVKLLDTLDTQLFLLQSDLIGVRRKLRRERTHMVRERRREQHKLTGFRNGILYTNTLLAQTLLVQHVVGLVQHKHFHSRRVERACFDQVKRLAWRADDKVCMHFLSTLQGIRNRVRRLHRREFAHGLRHIHDLTRKLTRRRQRNRLRLINTKVDAREHRQHKRRCLACAGLRLADHIARGVLQKQGERTLLDFGGLCKLHSINAFEQVGVQTKVIKRLDRVQW